MIIIQAPLKRSEVKRVIVEVFGDVEIQENRMLLSFESAMEEEKFRELKDAIKKDPVTSIIFCTIKKV